jgi:hypothetical protein
VNDVADYDPLYVAARTTLLDALEALGSQRKAIVVVGAQAVYMRTGDAVVAVAPYTTDADLALEPAQLADEPLVQQLLAEADFDQAGDPGVWFKSATVAGMPTQIEIDIMVPAGFAPPGGRRSVRLAPHDRSIARKAVGLEGAVLDNDPIDVSALDGSDLRRLTVRVAGPAALLVAKTHKLRDRLESGRADRIANKDAADVYRLILATPVREFQAKLRLLVADDVAGPPTQEAMALLGQLFGAPGSDGTRMAADALRIGVPPERVADVCTGFVRQLRDAMRVG